MALPGSDLRVCFLGDSFINGTGDPEYLGGPGRLARLERRRGHPLTLYNLGIRGDTSLDVARRWEAEIAGRLTKDGRNGLVFSFGVNDACPADNTLLPRVDEAVTLETTEAILTAARTRAPVLMVGPPPIADPSVNTRIFRLDEAFAAMCPRIGVPYLAVFASLRSDAEWIREATLGDGAHPAVEGYNRWAKLVFEWGPWRDLVDG